MPPAVLGPRLLAVSGGSGRVRSDRARRGWVGPGWVGPGHTPRPYAHRPAAARPRAPEPVDPRPGRYRGCPSRRRCLVGHVPILARSASLRLHHPPVDPHKTCPVVHDIPHCQVKTDSNIALGCQIATTRRGSRSRRAPPLNPMRSRCHPGGCQVSDGVGRRRTGSLPVPVEVTVLPDVTGLARWRTTGPRPCSARALSSCHGQRTVATPGGEKRAPVTFSLTPERSR